MQIVERPNHILEIPYDGKIENYGHILRIVEKSYDGRTYTSGSSSTNLEINLDKNRAFSMLHEGTKM